MGSDDTDMVEILDCQFCSWMDTRAWITERTRGVVVCGFCLNSNIAVAWLLSALELSDAELRAAQDASTFANIQRNIILGRSVPGVERSRG
jgi:hypothetical protein